MTAKPKIIVVVGPTASGKSALAVRLAKEIGGEVISADSRQVYRGLDIGAGKVTKKEMAGIPHHLLDVASPKRTFTVLRYKKLAERAVAGIIKRGKTPIICGGTGLYANALLDRVSIPPAPPNRLLRRRLERWPAEKLYARLRKLDPARAGNIDPRNPRRLIRALEIVLALGRVPGPKENQPPYEFLQIGVKIRDETLKTNIKERLERRLRRGLIAEVRKLRRRGLSFKRLEALGLEYRFVGRHLRGLLTREAMTRKLETAIWHYAKRQLTWFKKDKTIQWVESYAEAGNLVKKRLGLGGATRTRTSINGFGDRRSAIEL